MESKSKASFNLALNLILLLLNLPLRVVLSVDEYSINDFPLDFVFGSGTTAYQWEGAVNEDGRTPSVWDTFAHDGDMHEENGDVACDGYHKYKEDVKLMVETGLEAYRFSISWSRLIPNGRGPINPKALEFYNNLINELISNGIQPHVTLNNFDFPQALEDEYGGWISPQMISDFTNYADVCFREFGDRVLYWITVNEPNMIALGGYDQAIVPPQHCSPPFCVNKSIRGNSTTEPYLVVHHILLAHSSAARLYRTKYKDKQHGFVGITIYIFGLFPHTNTEKDRTATERYRDFTVGWIMEPFLHGDYPISMRETAGARIPSFTNRESELVKGSCDFIGLIHYSNANITDNSEALKNNLRDYTADIAAKLISGLNPFSNEEYPVAPWGLHEELNKFKLRYGNLPIFIYENGQRTPSNASLQDESRVKYLHGYIGATLDALRLSDPEIINMMRGKKVDQKLFQRLENILNVVEAVLNDAEKKQITDPAVKRWLENLQDAVYDADDSLDEVATKAATQKDPPGTKRGIP
ncbi:hydroxyisourate hydrolase isoform X4 [Arachis hypogaea]|uniref:hydroxyisourate hydrolase isoform X4 n=1 Tax=Arachis hypogaea TaxID=3818 RepID=UPI000DED0241|nr:hydroxyisourate hydrolase isoform X1 [Arachis hypogaea]